MDIGICPTWTRIQTLDIPLTIGVRTLLPGPPSAPHCMDRKQRYFMSKGADPNPGII